MLRHLTEAKILSNRFLTNKCRSIKFLPALDFNVRNGVEVSGQVVLVHHRGSSGRSQQTDPQVRDGEKVKLV